MVNSFIGRPEFGILGVALVQMCLASEFQLLPTTDTVYFGGTCMPPSIHWTVCSSDSFDTIKIVTDTINRIFVNGSFPQSACFVGPRLEISSYRLTGSPKTYFNDTIPIDSLCPFDCSWRTLTLTTHHPSGTIDSVKQKVKCWGGLRVERNILGDLNAQSMPSGPLHKQSIKFIANGRMAAQEQAHTKEIRHQLHYFSRER